jgi:hypothetical protein
MGSLRGEMGGLRGEMGGLRGEVSDLRGEMNARFDSLQRAMLQVGGGIVVALIGLIATQL